MAMLATLGDFLTVTWVGQEVWRLLAALGILIVAFLASRIARMLINRWGKRLLSRWGEESTEKASAAIGKALSAAIVVVGVNFAVRALTLPEKFEETVDRVLQVLVILVVGYGVYRLIDLIEAFLATFVEKTETKLDDMLLPIVRKSLKVLVVIVVALTAMDKLEYDVKAILATLGIGGLAIALAGKDTIANIFGSVMIFADQPFKIGERIKIGDADGPVEEVGLRSTKIRTLDGHLVSIPNSIVANEKIENIGKRPTIKRLFKIGVTYGTSHQKVMRAIDIIKEILDDTPGLEELRVVRFLEFADCSLNILVIFWVTNPDYLGEFLPINEKINFEILRRFNEEGIEFAFPTHTIHLIEEEKAKGEA